MTNEEAIIDIRENIQPIIGGKSLEIAISALEKQIPKKPILDTIFPSGVKWFRCPTCNNKIVSRLDGQEKYCSNCGQALDFNSNGSDSE